MRFLNVFFFTLWVLSLLGLCAYMGFTAPALAANEGIPPLGVLTVCLVVAVSAANFYHHNVRSRR